MKAVTWGVSFADWQIQQDPQTGMWRRVRWRGHWTPFIRVLKKQTASELIKVYYST